MTTIWKTAEIGAYTGSGSYDMFMAYFEAKGTITITTKVTFDNPDGTRGYAVVIARNNADFYPL